MWKKYKDAKYEKQEVLKENMNPCPLKGKKDIMVMMSMEEVFSTKMVQSNKVEETSLMYLDALKDDDIVTGITLFYSCCIILKHWPMFLSHHQAQSQICALLLCKVTVQQVRIFCFLAVCFKEEKVR